MFRTAWYEFWQVLHNAILFSRAFISKKHADRWRAAFNGVPTRAQAISICSAFASGMSVLPYMSDPDRSTHPENHALFVQQQQVNTVIILHTGARQKSNQCCWGTKLTVHACPRLRPILDRPADSALVSASFQQAVPYWLSFSGGC